MEATDVNKLITKALSPVKSTVTKLKTENTKLKAELKALKDEVAGLETGTGNIELTEATITIDPVNKTIKIETDAGNIETKIIDGIIKPPVITDPWCKKAAEQYLKDNLDLVPNGVTADTARSHYESFGKGEGRTWKSELCKQ